MLTTRGERKTRRWDTIVILSIPFLFTFTLVVQYMRWFCNFFDFFCSHWFVFSCLSTRFNDFLPLLSFASRLNETKYCEYVCIFGSVSLFSSFVLYVCSVRCWVEGTSKDKDDEYSSEHTHKKIGNLANSGRETERDRERRRALNKSESQRATER